MIKLFRNIRQNLLNEGKTTRYLKYAMGEIILVVIGILIALSINNWNENRKLEKDKFKLMLALKQEFLSNKENLEDQYNGLKTSNAYLHKLLNFSADTIVNLPIDSLRLYADKMLYPYQLTLLTSVQEEAISSGKFEMLNDSLKALLSLYKDYSKSLNAISEKSVFSNTGNDKTFDLLISLSTFQTINERMYPNRTVTMHSGFKMDDTDFVSYIKLPETYKMLYGIYNENMLIEVWTNQGLLTLSNRILEEIDEQLKL